MRPAITVADYLLAVARLDVHDARRQHQISVLLGLSDAAGPAPGGAVPGSEHAPEGRTEPVGATDSAGEREPARTAFEPAADIEVPIFIERLDRDGFEVGWPEDLPPLAVATMASGPRPPAPPLISPVLERGIVQLLLASTRSSGGLDLDALLDACVRLDLHQPLPELEERTVHGGTNLLVDVSSAMAPFADDVERLLRVAENVGGEATRCFYFEHCPGRELFTDEPDEILNPEQRTVVVGTFGCGPAAGSAGHAEWRAAILQLRERATVIGIAPFAAAGDAFRDLLPMVSWSEATTTTAVQRALWAV